MFHKLGVNWAGSLLGFLAVAFMPIPFLFYIYGPKLRKMSRYAPTEFGKQPQQQDEESADTEEESRIPSNEDHERRGTSDTLQGEHEKIGEDEGETR